LKNTGLGNLYWNEVINVLRSVIPVYNKVNSIISLGKDNQYRKEGIINGIKPGNIILDAGSGFGNMSKTAAENVSNDITIYFYDPIYEMLKRVKGTMKSYLPSYNIFLCSGVFENIPFKSNTFDAVLCGYSLRDAIDLDIAIKELCRVLKKNGRLIIVDLGKPDNFALRLFVSFYLKYFLTILAFIAAGKKGLPFKTLYGTFLRWPKNKELNYMLSKNFSKVHFNKKLLGGSIVVIAYK